MKCLKTQVCRINSKPPSVQIYFKNCKSLIKYICPKYKKITQLLSISGTNLYNPSSPSISKIKTRIIRSPSSWPSVTLRNKIVLDMESYQRFWIWVLPVMERVYSLGWLNSLGRFDAKRPEREVHKLILMSHSLKNCSFFKKTTEAK